MKSIKLFSKYYFWLIILLILGVFYSAFVMRYQPSHELPKVAIIQFNESPALDQARLGVIDELKVHGFRDQESIQLTYDNGAGNKGLVAQKIQKRISENAKLIIAIGTDAAIQSRLNVNKENDIIPVIYVSVTDPRDAALVEVDGDRSNDFITGVSDFIDPMDTLSFVKTIQENIKTVGLLVNPYEQNSVSLLLHYRKAMGDLNIRLIEIPIHNKDMIAKQIHNKAQYADAIIVDNVNLAFEHLDMVIRGAKKLNIPLYISDIDSFKEGVFAAFGPKQVIVGKQAGEMAAYILSGKSKGDLLIPQTPEAWEILINEDLAKKYTFKIPDNFCNTNQDNIHIRCFTKNKLKVEN